MPLHPHAKFGSPFLYRLHGSILGQCSNGKPFPQEFDSLVVKAVDPDLFNPHYICQPASRFYKYIMDGIIAGGFLDMTLGRLDVLPEAAPGRYVKQLTTPANP
jgi:hypothetical protein